MSLWFVVNNQRFMPFGIRDDDRHRDRRDVYRG